MTVKGAAYDKSKERRMTVKGAAYDKSKEWRMTSQRSGV